MAKKYYRQPVESQEYFWSNSLGLEVKHLVNTKAPRLMHSTMYYEKTQLLHKLPKLANSQSPKDISLKLDFSTENPN